MQKLVINGKIRQVDVDPDMPLLWVLRDVLDMTGTKYGCGKALWRSLHRARGWGGHAVVRTAGRQCDGKENHHHRRGGARPKPATPCKRHGSPPMLAQCGYCQSGQIMSAAALIARNKSPTDADIGYRHGLGISADAGSTAESVRYSSGSRGRRRECLNEMSRAERREFLRSAAVRAAD